MSDHAPVPMSYIEAIDRCEAEGKTLKAYVDLENGLSSRNHVRWLGTMPHGGVVRGDHWADVASFLLDEAVVESRTGYAS